MRLKNYPHFLTLVVLFGAVLCLDQTIQAAPDTKITPSPVPVLKKPKGKKEVIPTKPPETALPTLQITIPALESTEVDKD